MRDPAKNTPGAPLSRLQEQRIIRAVRSGDREAARTLIEYHQQRLFAFVWRIVPNQQEAEDVCQDAFLKAITSIDSFDPTYRFSTWLFTIAYRLGLNGRRRRQRCVDTDMDFSTLESAGRESPDQALESEEAARLRSEVWDAVGRLSGPQRAAVTLFYRESLSCQEIAEMMEVPLATVKSHLHRARAKLKGLLEPLFDGDWQRLRILEDAVA